MLCFKELLVQTAILWLEKKYYHSCRVAEVYILLRRCSQDFLSREVLQSFSIVHPFSPQNLSLIICIGLWACRGWGCVLIPEIYLAPPSRLLFLSSEGCLSVLGRNVSKLLKCFYFLVFSYRELLALIQALDSGGDRLAFFLGLNLGEKGVDIAVRSSSLPPLLLPPLITSSCCKRKVTQYVMPRNKLFCFQEGIILRFMCTRTVLFVSRGNVIQLLKKKIVSTPRKEIA